jgi:perosamine synthetase
MMPSQPIAVARATEPQRPPHDAFELALSRPDICEADIQSVVGVLRTPFLSLGPKVGEFERAFCDYTGARFATAVSSGTAALHLAVKALDLQPGDEIITSPFSFVASANCALFVNAVPVFVDIDPVSFNLDPASIERRITSRTRAILPVHVFGRPANMHEVMDIARRHDLRVIEDACEALGARWCGRHVGTFGDVGTFAFYPNKQITTGEGGMLVTEDPDLDRQFKSLRNQGRGSSGAWLQHEQLGFNYRLSDINCALGLSQLLRVVDILQRRRAVAEEYRRQLADIEHLELPIHESDGAELSWFVYVVRLKGYDFSEREEVLRALRSKGIGCNNYFAPLHLMPHFRELGHREGDFPITESIAASTVALPFYTSLRSDQIARVSDVLRRALARLDTSHRRRATIRLAAVAADRASAPSSTRSSSWSARP